MPLVPARASFCQIRKVTTARVSTAMKPPQAPNHEEHICSGRPALSVLASLQSARSSGKIWGSAQIPDHQVQRQGKNSKAQNPYWQLKHRWLRQSLSRPCPAVQAAINHGRHSLLGQTLTCADRSAPQHPHLPPSVRVSEFPWGSGTSPLVALTRGVRGWRVWRRFPEISLSTGY